MNESTILFSTLYGSHLYGLNTPQSDRDEKYIVLPPLEDLLLGHKIKNKVQKTNKEGANGPDDVDREYIPIQVFARDFLKGQAYALELAHAVDGYHCEQKGRPDFATFCRELRNQFLTSDITALMGYAVHQASMYSFKGERLNCAIEVLKVFKDFNVNGKYDEKTLEDMRVHSKDDNKNEEVAKLWYPLNLLAKTYFKYFRFGQYLIDDTRQRSCFYLLEKCYPFTTTFKHLIKMLGELENRYGRRVRDASKDNVDWKASMHAMRIVDSGIMLLTTNSLHYPVPEVARERYLAIKRGEVPIEEYIKEIDEKLDKLKELEVNSDLRKRTEETEAEFDKFLIKWLSYFYRLDLK